MVEEAQRTVRKAWEIKLESLKKCEKEIEDRQIAKKEKENKIESSDSIQLSDVSEDESCCEEHEYEQKLSYHKKSDDDKMKAIKFKIEHRHFGIKAVDLEDLA